MKIVDANADAEPGALGAKTELLPLDSGPHAGDETSCFSPPLFQVDSRPVSV